MGWAQLPGNCSAPAAAGPAALGGDSWGGTGMGSLGQGWTVWDRDGQGRDRDGQFVR